MVLFFYFRNLFMEAATHRLKSTNKTKGVGAVRSTNNVQTKCLQKNFVFAFAHRGNNDF